MLIILPLLGVMMIACITDFLYRKIPNILLIPAALYGVLISVLGLSRNNLIDAVLGLLVGLLIFSIPYYKSWIGAGDVKLIGVIGIYLGPGLTIISSIYAMLAGGLLAVIYAVYQAQVKESFRNVIHLRLSSHQIPYAVAISLGTCSALFISRE